MARLISIDVPFENQHFTALVSIKQTKPDLCCVVRYIDKKVKFLLSGDQVIFGPRGGIKQPNNLPSELAESLYRCTTEALQAYLPNRA